MLNTQRLIIRKFNINDAKALFSILSDEEVNKYLPWFPFQSLEETKLHLQKFYLNTKVIFRMYQLNLDDYNKRVYKGYWNKYTNHFIENML